MWATFKRKIFVKTFQRQPHLPTLRVIKDFGEKVTSIFG